MLAEDTAAHIWMRFSQSEWTNEEAEARALNTQGAERQAPWGRPGDPRPRAGQCPMPTWRQLQNRTTGDGSAAGEESRPASSGLGRLHPAPLFEE